MSSLFPIRGLKQYPLLSDGPLIIDWSNPITNGLAAAFLPGLQLRDISGQITDIAISPAGTGGFVNTIEGPALTSTAAVSDATSGNGNANLGNWTTASVYARFNIGAGTSTTNDFWGITTNSAANCAMAISGTTTARSYAVLTSAFTQLANTTGVLSANAVHSVMATQSGVNYVVYADGKNITSGANAVAPTGRAAVYEIAVNLDVTTSLICEYVWLRQLSDSEALWMDQNPYGFLIPSYGLLSNALKLQSIWVPNPTSIMPDWV